VFLDWVVLVACAPASPPQVDPRPGKLPEVSVLAAAAGVGETEAAYRSPRRRRHGELQRPEQDVAAAPDGLGVTAGTGRPGCGAVRSGSVPMSWSTVGGRSWDAVDVAEHEQLRAIG